MKLALMIATEENRPISEYPLHGRTMTEARDWVRSKVTLLGADASHYTLTRPYEIPRHDVAIGDSFDASEQSCFEELSKWFANAAALLGTLARTTDKASDVRCWPHHFDIGTLLKVSSGRTIGVGLDPGDRYYDEPYFYVNLTPQPSPARARSRPLWGSGTWHTKEWVGAVLCGSRLGSASSQERQTREFLDSAISACRAMLTFD